MFLRMEFWKLSPLGWQRGGIDAYDDAVKSLERRGFIKMETHWLFLEEGRFQYQTLDGTPWIIESIWADETVRQPDGTTFVLERNRRNIYASPTESWSKFQKSLSRDAPKNATNLFTLHGMRCDTEKHDHFTVTDDGWDQADISPDDFMAEETKPPKKSRGRLAATDPGRVGRIASWVVDHIVATLIAGVLLTALLTWLGLG